MANALQKCQQTCWPIILFNYNLPPTEHFQLQNVILLGVIPGPRQMKDTNSFLLPMVEELEDLACGIPSYNAHTQDHFLLQAFRTFGGRGHELGLALGKQTEARGRQVNGR